MAADPVFEEEQKHLSDTYEKLVRIESEVRSRLEADLAEAERKLAREDHLDRKYALAKETQRIGKEIRQCQNSNT